MKLRTVTATPPTSAHIEIYPDLFDNQLRTLPSSLDLV